MGELLFLRQRPGHESGPALSLPWELDVTVRCLESNKILTPPMNSSPTEEKRREGSGELVLPAYNPAARMVLARDLVVIVRRDRRKLPLGAHLTGTTALILY